jgi:hypothetical protein
MDYNVIYDFCKVRNLGTAMVNGKTEYTPRVKFILTLLEKMGIKYEVDTFPDRSGRNSLHNIYLRGTSNKWVMAHHDVCNHTTDNANDNSASVINAIGLKSIRPDINIALVDAEEPPLGGQGSFHFGERVNENTLDVEWVLNLELTGSGGTNFFIGDYGTDLTNKIQAKFNCPLFHPPFNDATILIGEHNINAALINPLPLKGSNFSVEQIGIVNDLLAMRKPKKTSGWKSWLLGNGDGDFTDDELDEIDFEFGGDFSAWKESKEESDEVVVDVDDSKFIEGNWNFNIGYIRTGDTFTQKQYNSIKNELQQLKFNPKNKAEEFIVSEQPIVVPDGEIARIDQMDIEVLYRCHTKDDTVEHIRPDEMREFVEKVLAVICEL